MGRVKDTKQEDRVKRVQWAIILAAAAVSVFVICCTYPSRPINIYNIQKAGEGEKASQRESSIPMDSSVAGSSFAAGPSSGTAYLSTSEEYAPSAAMEVLMEKEIDLNAAGKEELMKLPGIGPILAERILQYRAENGDFLDIEELKSVDGIGEKTFEKLREYIYAG